MRGRGQAHHGGAAWDDCRPGVIDADVLDAWFPPAPDALEALRAAPEWYARTSPPSDCRILVDAVSSRHGIDAERIVVGAGSSDLIFRALTRWCRPASRALLLDPGYSEYAHVLENLCSGEVRLHALSKPDGFSIDLGTIAQRARECDLVVLVNPNNPAGCPVSSADVAELREQLPARTLLWIDEAYMDYTKCESFQGQAGERTVVLRSLSKSLALSGLRAAYAVMAPASADEIRALTPPWAVSLPAQLAARAALADPAYYAARYEETHRLQEGLAGSLRGLGLEVWPGAANWVLAFLPDGLRAAAVVRAAAAEGLYIRDACRTSKALGDCAVRISVKDGPTQERMVDTLKRALARAR